MNILICIDSLRKGGAERVVSNLSNFLINSHNVEILTVADEKPAYELNKNIKFVNVSRKTNGKGKIGSFRARVKIVEDELEKFQPDVVLAFLPYTSFIVSMANRKCHKKLIISVRNDPRVEYKTLKYKFLKWFYYPKADGFVMQTEDMKRYFSKKIQCKSVVIPNPIDMRFVDKFYSGKRTKEIVTVGRLYEQKNHKMLISVFAGLSKDFPEYKLCIYGEGYLRRDLERYVQKRGMGEKVSLPGAVDNVPDKIRKAACFVLSSDYEGMPNALMEAMALGLPVISTDCPCGGPRALIKNNQNGILVRVRDKEQMTMAISKILSDSIYAGKLGKQASKILETLEPSKVCRQWNDFIEYIWSA